MKTIIAILILSLSIGACAAQPSTSSTATSHETVAEYVEILAEDLDWSLPVTTPIAIDPTGLSYTYPTLYDGGLDQGIADRVGLTAWEWTGLQEFPPSPDQNCASSGSTIGCSIHWGTGYSFEWVCWIKTSYGSAYCYGGGDFEDTFMTSKGFGRVIKRINGICGVGTLRC